MKYILLLCSLMATVAMAQNPGDTTVVETFNYSQTYGRNQWSPGIRDTNVVFPSATNSWERIILSYNMRCKNNLISDGSDRDKGCGEWDISCSTFIHDSTRVDSVEGKYASHTISDQSGDGTYDFTTAPTYDDQQQIQQITAVLSATGNSVSLEDGSSALQSNALQTEAFGFQSLFIIDSAELASLDSSMLYQLALEVTSPESVNELDIAFASTDDDMMADVASDFSLNFQSVYHANTSFSSGSNTLVFHTPYEWDRTSNLVVRITHTNQGNGQSNLSLASVSAPGKGMKTSSSEVLSLDNIAYLTTPNYKGIGGDTARTIEAWIKTSVNRREFISWGVNSSGQKCYLGTFNDGTLLFDATSGYLHGSTVVTDGEWHHVAVSYPGGNIQNATLYVDGVEETNTGGNGLAMNTNIEDGIPVNISRGHHNRYFEGEIDEIRVWRKDLSQQEIRDWARRDIDSSHPQYSHLELYLPMETDASGNIIDKSPLGHAMSQFPVDQLLWELRGENIPANLVAEDMRPAFELFAGETTLSASEDTVLIRANRKPKSIVENILTDNSGTSMSDEVNDGNMYTWYPAEPLGLLDASGNIISTTPVAADTSITVTTERRFDRSPMAFEIMSLVTPYGLGLDLGEDGVTFYFDVTDFAPILHGKRRITIERGGQWMEDMDIQFLFIEGTPVRDVLDIQQVWSSRTGSRRYQDINADNYFAPRSISLLPNASSFALRSAITGHGQEGEFIPRTHTINLDGGSNEFSWSVWKACGKNPIYPQGGTWIYDRAGWCPGMATDIQTWNLDPYVSAGQTHEFDYNVVGATGDSRYHVTQQLVSYGDFNHVVDARMEIIKKPNSNIEQGRQGLICNEPEVTIKNTGSSPITEVIIAYGVNGVSAPNTALWTGNLAPLDTVSIVLSTQDIYSNVQPENNRFFARIEQVNGSVDNYVPNNELSVPFGIPAVMPKEFILQVKTNKRPEENYFELTNSAGDVIWSLDPTQEETIYTDTMDLLHDCYTLRMEDTGGDGLEFFANPDAESGYVRFRKITGIPLRILERDFGEELTYSFTVEWPLETQENVQLSSMEVTPNPTTDILFVSIPTKDVFTWKITDLLGNTIIEGKSTNTEAISVADLPSALYLFTAESGQSVWTERFVKQE